MKVLQTISKYSLIFFLFLNYGCSNKNKLPDPPLDLKYNAVALVDGPLSDYMEAIPNQYLFELTKSEEKYLMGYSGNIKIKFKFIKSIDIKAGIGYNQYGPSLRGKALDERGIPLDFELNIIADKDLANYLRRGSGEEWLTIRLFAQGIPNSYDDGVKMLEKFKHGKSIRFISEIQDEKSGSNSTNSSLRLNENKSISSDDCELFLKGYEEFMLKYVDLIKRYKASPNNPSLLSDYTNIMVESQKWAGKTSSCSSDQKFVVRYTEIQMKIANALSENK
jgi:hypothetical protein